MIRMVMSYQVAQFNIPPGFIDLGLGDPQFKLLPLNQLEQAAQDCFHDNDPGFLQYGATQGDGRFRNALSSFLAQRYGFQVNPESLFISSGVSMNLHMICSLFTHPGDVIFVEEPTYLYALRIFTDYGLELIPIPTDPQGMLTELVEEKIVQSCPKFIYTIPTHQNPSGWTLSAERRKQLVELCARHNILLVADEVYHFLSYNVQPPPSFASEIESGKILSLGSFSKILAPGLRLGWMQANQEILTRFNNCGVLESGGGLNPFTSAIVCRMLESGGLDRNINRLVFIYRQRLAILDAALRKHLPELEYNLPEGGYFFWIRLPGGLNAVQLRNHAAHFQIDFRPGNLFSHHGRFGDFIRLSYVFYEAEELELGVLRLRQAIEEMHLQKL